MPPVAVKWSRAGAMNALGAKMPATFSGSCWTNEEKSRGILVPSLDGQRDAAVVLRGVAGKERVAYEAELVVRARRLAQHRESVAALRVQELTHARDPPVLHPEGEEVADRAVTIAVDGHAPCGRHHVDLRVSELRRVVLERANPAGAHERLENLEVLGVH